MTVPNDRLERLAEQLHDASVYAAQIADAREQPAEDAMSGYCNALTDSADRCWEVVESAGNGADGEQR